MRTLRHAAARGLAAAAMLVVLGLSQPAGAQQPAAPPEKCAGPGLGPVTPCVDPGEAPVTTVAPKEADQADAGEPGPAVWIGAVFGASGLVGVAFATVRIREPEPEEEV